MHPLDALGEQRQNTALHRGSEQGHLEMVQHLTQCEGIDLNAVDEVPTPHCLLSLL